MKRLIENSFNIMVGVTILIVIWTFFVTAAATRDLEQRVNTASKQADVIAYKIASLSQAVKEAELTAIEAAFIFAPAGQTIYQLRGNAQETAQTLINKLTKLYHLPDYVLPTIRFRPVLYYIDDYGNRSPNAAGTATNCEDGPIYTIALNEILFLRNYEEYLYIVIPHEVSHVMTCLMNGFPVEDGESIHHAAHGEEWQQVMSDIGFINPTDFIVHNMNLRPVVDYQRDLASLLDAAFQRAQETENERN